MATFYFVRHGQADFSEAGIKIYQGRGFNLLTLSEQGKDQKIRWKRGFLRCWKNTRGLTM